ncbi:uncharacterized protein LOC135112323 [Scylla paramamosain]|uniref:uncharacterized protein LOC135112323 n=1 Tax=Scylla paramamosain TaxID=85552 RepID=UPI003082A71C
MQGIIIVWLLVCSLPAIHHALHHVSESTSSLCEQNLRQDDAMEILEPSFTKFEDWARAFCLTDSTIETLVAQNLNSRMFLMMLIESDVDALGLTVGQKRILMVVVEKLQEAEAREAARRERSRKNQFSDSHDVALRRQKRDGSFSSAPRWQCCNRISWTGRCVCCTTCFDSCWVYICWQLLLVPWVPL